MTLTDSLMDGGGVDAVRETTMRELRAGIRERQRMGRSKRAIRRWIDGQEAQGLITEAEGAVARFAARSYDSI